MRTMRLGGPAMWIRAAQWPHQVSHQTPTNRLVLLITRDTKPKSDGMRLLCQRPGSRPQNALLTTGALGRCGDVCPFWRELPEHVQRAGDLWAERWRESHE